MLIELCDTCGTDVTNNERVDMQVTIHYPSDPHKSNKPYMPSKVLCIFCMVKVKEFLNKLVQGEEDVK